MQILFLNVQMLMENVPVPVHLDIFIFIYLPQISYFYSYLFFNTHRQNNE